MALLNENDFAIARNNWKTSSSPVALPYLEKLQDLAWSQFLELGLPNRTDEMWKYTNLASVLSSPLSLVQKQKSLTTTLASDSKLVFLDGVLVALPAELIRQGLLITSSSARTLTESQAKKIYQSTSKVRDGVQAIGLSAPTDVVYIEVLKSTRLEKPLTIEYRSTGASHWIQPLMYIDVAENAELQLLEIAATGESEEGIINGQLQIAIGSRAQVHHLRSLSLSASTKYLSRVSVQQKLLSHYQSTILARGGSILRNVLIVEQQEPQAEAECNGLYLTENKEHSDHRVVIHHLAERGWSRQLYKGVLKDASRAVFNGKIYIGPGAQKVDSKQMNQNLVLDRRAEIDSKPELEVYADDVTANHGSAIGQLDPQQLFYLMSRAIPRPEAIRILSKGFIEEVVLKVRSKALRAASDEWMMLALDHFQKSVEKFGDTSA
jgi:Fe-S cluster assembly protein SufD